MLFVFFLPIFPSHHDSLIFFVFHHVLVVTMKFPLFFFVSSQCFLIRIQVRFPASLPERKVKRSAVVRWKSGSIVSFPLLRDSTPRVVPLLPFPLSHVYLPAQVHRMFPSGERSLLLCLFRFAWNKSLPSSCVYGFALLYPLFVT